MHLPLSDVTKAELKELTLSTQQLISPSSSRPIVYVVQDTLIGSYLFTQPGVELKRDEIFNLMMYNREFVNDLAGGKTSWSSRDVFSMILPKTFSFEQYGLKIVNGKMIEGVLDKSILGDKADSLLQNIHNMYSPEACKNFLNNIQDIITLWLSYTGFSVGVGDAMPTKKIRKNVAEILDDKLDEAWSLVQQLHQGIYQPDLADAYLESSFESDMMGILGSANNQVEEVVMDNISKYNSFYRAFKSGSKGKASNIKMIMGNIGQQTIWGKRIPEKFTSRTLPHFNKYDCGPIARGFVKNSFIGGLSPSEVFFHAMDGRTGLIDTAVKTAKSGYVQRRLMKAMEDLKVEYDGTVRNAEGNIVQFVYGEDNMDPVKIERTKLMLITYDNKQMENIYKFDVDMDEDSWLQFMQKGAVAEMKKSKEWKKIVKDEYERVLGYRDALRTKYFPYQTTMMDKIMTPVNYYRLITSSLYKFSINKYDKSELTPEEVINKVDELCDISTKYLRDKNSLLMFKMLTRSSLSSKQCIYEHRMNRITFNEIIETAKKKVLDSFIQPGEMVGPLAAQSIGEPSTQLTLNTFHLSGHAGKSSVTSTGVPRLEEIINLYKTIKTPSTIIYLKPEYASKHEKALQVKNKMEYTKLENIVERTEILHEEMDVKTSSDEDYEFIQTYYDFSNILKVDNNTEESLSKWVLRVVFDKESMLNKNIVISDVQEAIMKRCNTDSDIQTIFSDDNSGNIVMRFKVKTDSGDSSDLQFMKEWEKNVVNITLRGIPLYNNYDPNDIGVGMFETNRIVYNEDGSYSAIKEWSLDTKGINLVDIMAFEEVDQRRTLSNDFYEAYEIFGILGVRNMLISEINTVLSGEGVNYRHLTMLADTMTYKGHMMPISRHGINRSADYGPIGKSSFEEMTDMLLKSATYAEVDNMQGSSANVMMGQFVKAGTNSFDLKLDEEAIMGSDGDGDDDNSEDNSDDGDTSDSDMEGHEVEAEIDSMYDNVNEEFDAHHDDFGINLNLNQQHKLGVIDEDIDVRIGGKGIDIKIQKKNDDSEDDSEDSDSDDSEDDSEDDSDVESEEDSEDDSEDDSDVESDDEIENVNEKKNVKKVKVKVKVPAKKIVIKKKSIKVAKSTKAKPKNAVKKLIIKPKSKAKK